MSRTAKPLSHEEWVDLQLNLGRKRARREQKQCRLIEAGPAYVHYRIGVDDVIFTDHDDGNGIGRITGANYFNPRVPPQLYGELEIEAETYMKRARDHIKAAKLRRKQARTEPDPQQLVFTFSGA